MNNRFIATWIFSFWAFISRSSVLATRRWFREMLLNLSIIQSATLSNNFLINFKIYVNFSSLESEGEKTIIKISRYVNKSHIIFQFFIVQNFLPEFSSVSSVLVPTPSSSFQKKTSNERKMLFNKLKKHHLLNQNKPYSTEHAGQHLWHSKLNVIHIKITIY